MTPRLQHIQNLRHVFQKSVESVRPHNLLSANGYSLTPKTNGSKGTTTIQIQGKTLDLTGKNCYVIGFGKAVLGMAAVLEKSLSKHLESGIISIPKGSLDKFRDNQAMQLSEETKIHVYEGAPNNQPDICALEAATKIKELAECMTQDDVLFVLISGGGSALLPLPRPPLTLEEKMQLVRELANRSASIEEMNVVRIAMSSIKGGRLAAAARDAYAVVSFVISDIVGDPVDLIASGPTCAALGKGTTAKDILEKYGMWDNLPEHIRQVIQTPIPEEESQPGPNNTIYVVGTNRVAAATAVEVGAECGYNPFIVSTTIHGEISTVLSKYRGLLCSIYRFRRKEIDGDQFREEFPFDGSIFDDFLKKLNDETGRPLFLIAAGEPTVMVNGSGVGGRSQELALRMSLELYENPNLKDISFLSAGTDGIDGPTSAAGAIGSSLVVDDYLKSGRTLADLKSRMLENDSFNFYSQLNEGKYHIITGHTGTNVMDLHLLLVP